MKRIMFVLAVLITAASPADAGLLDRVLGKAVSEQVLGTALTPPLVVEGSLETEVYVFSTTVGRPLTRVRFPASSNREVRQRVQVGSTVAVLTADAIADGGDAVLVARRWWARTDGNPTRADFMARSADLILLYTLRGDVNALARVFRGREGVLAQLSANVQQVEAALVALGIEPARMGAALDLELPRQ